MNTSRREERRHIGNRRLFLEAQRRFLGDDTNIFLLFVATLGLVCFFVGSVQQHDDTSRFQGIRPTVRSYPTGILSAQQETEDLQHDDFYFFHGRPAWEEFTWQGRLTAFQTGVRRIFGVRRVGWVNDEENKSRYESTGTRSSEQMPSSEEAALINQVKLLLRQEEELGFLRPNSRVLRRRKIDKGPGDELFRLPN